MKSVNRRKGMLVIRLYVYGGKLARKIVDGSRNEID